MVFKDIIYVCATHTYAGVPLRPPEEKTLATEEGATRL